MFRKSWVAVFLLSLSAAVCTIIVSAIGLTEHAELKVLDMMFRLRGQRSIAESPIVIVAVDDASFVSLQHKWPFPRTYFAEAIQNLHEAGARMVIFDIEFTEKSLSQPAQDSVLAVAVACGMDVIFAGKIVLERHSSGTIHRYAQPPIPSLLNKNSTWAYANIGHDTDGFLRRYSLYQTLGGATYLPLSMEAYRRLKSDSCQCDIDIQGRRVNCADVMIPIYQQNSMLINYYGPAGFFPTYSIANILDDADFDLPDDEDTDIFEIHKLDGTFRNKIVFVGATTDELQDNKFTPFFYFNDEKRKTPGVEVHANALQMLLDRAFIRQVHASIQVILVILLSLIVGCCSRFFKPLVSLIGWITLFSLLLATAMYLFVHYNTLIMIVSPAIALTLSFVLHLVHRLITEYRQKGFYRRTFQQYISRSVVDTMLNSGKLPQFGGERKTLTVLFSDIRSFTSYCEKYAPEEVVTQLSEYLSAMVDVIFKHEGTLDKFVGDEIMALFGAPYYYENHAERACHTALDMMRSLAKLRQQWAIENKDGFNIGIGINTGKVIVGNLGSVQLFDYTVIGDEVNLGARLEGANKFYGTSIIISESTFNQVKDRFVARELDNVCVKGKKKPVRIFELMSDCSLTPREHESLIVNYTNALQLFRSRKWEQALALFTRILDDFPNDGPARLYSNRCRQNIENPPEEAWTPMFEFMTK